MVKKRALLASGFLLAACSLIYGFAIEPRRLTVTNLAIREGRLAKILAGRKVAILGDLHFASDGEPAAMAALQRLGEIRPDLILLTGDYVEWGSGVQAYEKAFDFLASLQAPLGVYAVLGDADFTLSRKSCEFCHQPGSGAPTERHRVIFMKNEQRQISTSEGDVRILGLDPGDSTPVARRLRRLLKGDAPTLLLSHSSVVFRDIEATREVLVLSGDTHGGQVRLPGWFWRLTRFKPDPTHISGFFRDVKKTLFVTRGVGTAHVRFRLGVPPEIVVLEFGG